ncbi:MAG: hypothetical protein ACKOEH_07850, partial [Actinomycetota bacterium]
MTLATEFPQRLFTVLRTKMHRRHGELQRVAFGFGQSQVAQLIVASVDPIGHLAGRVTAQGFCLDRIEGRVVAGEARAFKAPENFEVAAAVPTEKQMLAAGDGEITTATVLVDAALAPGVRREFGESFVVREREDGGVEFAIPCA